MKEKIIQLWQCIDAQHWDALPDFFAPDAIVNWHNSDESFTVPEFVQANRHYPGRWRIAIQRVEICGEKGISACRVSDGTISLHVCSFFTFAQEKVVALDEYWGEDGPAPTWRQEMGIGRPIASVSRPKPSRWADA